VPALFGVMGAVTAVGGRLCNCAGDCMDPTESGKIAETCINNCVRFALKKNNTMPRLIDFKLIDFKALRVFATGYCFNECVEKDYALKRLFCILACRIASYSGCKITYQSAALSYNQYVKLALETFVSKRKRGKLPPLSPTGPF
jgi:hypothetical protein